MHNVVNISNSENEDEITTLQEDLESHRTAPDLQETGMTNQDDDTLVLLAESDPDLTEGKVQDHSQQTSI